MQKISARIVWATPNAEQMIADIARVSSDRPAGSPFESLIRSLVRRRHWSPLEMVNVCIEINAPRDVTRQVLRHWTLRPQEFSQRYANVAQLGDPFFRECRMQHPHDRQRSIPTDETRRATAWEAAQREVWNLAHTAYQGAIANGVAREVARAVLPEGMTPSRIYLNGSARSWLHFCALRSGHGTQAETQEVAHKCSAILAGVFPHTWENGIAEAEVSISSSREVRARLLSRVHEAVSGLQGNGAGYDDAITDAIAIIEGMIEGRDDL